MSLRQLIFVLLFAILHILALLLGTTFVVFYLLLGFCLFFWIFRHQLQTSVLFANLPLLGLWLVFLGSMVISGFFTHSVPLTLSSTIYFSFSFVYFCFFLTLKRTLLPERLLIIAMLSLGFVATSLSIFFYLNPSFGSLLPEMNILFPTYGHNHLAALLLLVYPLSWLPLFVQSTSKKWSIWQTIPILIFTFAFLISFGRTAIFFAFIELLMIIWLLRKQWHKIPVIGSVIIVIAGLLFGLLLVFKAAVSINPNLVPSYFCEGYFLKRVVCKPLELEMRPFFWGQAGQAIMAHPLFGYGPGTFPLINKQYRQTPFTNTAYAHNAYLEVAAEMGIIAGGAFLILVIYLAFLVARISKKSRSPLIQLITISWIAISGNAFFDFDWNFLGTWLLSLFLVAWAIGSDQPDQKKIKLEGRIRKFVQVVLGGVYLGIIGVSVLYIFIDSLIRVGQLSSSMVLFPYFHAHSLVFLNATELNQNQKAKLAQIYQYHPEYYQNILSNSPGIVLPVEWWADYYQVDPWIRVLNPTLVHLLETTHDAQIINQELKRYESMVARISPGELILQKKALSHQLWSLGESLQTREPELAVSAFSKAYIYNPHIFHEKAPLVPDPQTATGFGELLARVLNEDAVSSLGQHTVFYTDLYVTSVTDELTNPNLDLALVEAKLQRDIHAVKKNPFALVRIWERGSQDLILAINDVKLNDNIEAAQRLVKLWDRLFVEIDSLIPLDRYAEIRALCEEQREIANRLLVAQEQGSGEHLQQALRYPFDLCPQWWISDSVLVKKATDQQLLEVLTKIQDPQVVSSAQNYRLFDAVVLELFSRKYAPDSNPVLQNVQLPAHLVVVRNSSVEMALLKIFKSAAASENIQRSADFMIEAAPILNQTYWGATQMGNYYFTFQEKVAMNWQDEATQHFRQCLDQQPAHSDCQFGLEQIADQAISPTRFWEVFAKLGL